MAKEIDTRLDKKVVPLLKREQKGDLKRGDLVDEMVKAGVPKAQVSLFMYRLEHVADSSLKLGKTPKQIRAARETGLRWERIAYRAGLVDSEGSLGAGVTKARSLCKQGGLDPDAYVGRGRRFDGSTGSSDGATPKRGAAGKRSSAKRGAATSGRRQAAAAKAETPKRGAAGKRGAAAAAKRGAGKRGTRAQAGSDPR